MYQHFSKINKVVLFVNSALLAIAYLFEFEEEYIKEIFPYIIPLSVFVHWIFFVGGWMLIGFPLSYMFRSIVKKVIPKELEALLEESRKKYPFSNYAINMYWWTIFLPAFFGGIILFLILFRIEPASFKILYYILPFGGVVYISFKDRFEDIMEITFGGEKS